MSRRSSHCGPAQETERLETWHRPTCVRAFRCAPGTRYPEIQTPDVDRLQVSAHPYQCADRRRPTRSTRSAAMCTAEGSQAAAWRDGRLSLRGRTDGRGRAAGTDLARPQLIELTRR